MTAIITKDSYPDFCPKCGEKDSIFSVTPTGVEYDKKLKLSEKELSKLCSFDAMICRVCGFAWIPNDSVTTSSVAALYSLTAVNNLMSKLTGTDYDALVAGIATRVQSGLQGATNITGTVDRSVIYEVLMNDVFASVNDGDMASLLKLYLFLAPEKDAVESLVKVSHVPEFKTPPKDTQELAQNLVVDD